MDQVNTFFLWKFLQIRELSFSAKKTHLTLTLCLLTNSYSKSQDNYLQKQFPLFFSLIQIFALFASL